MRKTTNTAVLCSQRDALLDLRRQGHGIKAIGRALGVSPQSVHRFLHHLGIQTPKRPSGPTSTNVKSFETHYMRHLNDEAKAMRTFDESRHWRNHPEALPIYRNLSPEKRLEHCKKLWARRKNSPAYVAYMSRPGVMLRYRLRARIWKALKAATKSASTMTLTGCTPKFLKEWLESQFERGMSWANYGSGWEVDHIMPCASFDLSDPKQQATCFHYSNLRPLWMRENRSKRSTPLKCVQPELPIAIP